MSISQEIQRIKTNIANAYTQAKNKGATLPQSQNSANLADTIKSIPGGSGLEVKHGIAYTEVDEDGYVTKAKVVGLNTVPAYAFLSPAINEKLEKVELEDGITKIETQAFNLCSNLKEVNIPESVTSLEDNAFRYCSNIKNIELSKNIVTIGEYAFYNCSSLENINVPEGVTSIEASTFSGCNNLKNIELSKNITTIKQYAFYNCSSLENINVPENVTSIGNYAFFNCNSATTLSLPKTLSSLGTYSFNECNNLESITVASGNSKYASLTTKYLYSYNGSYYVNSKRYYLYKLIKYPAKKETEDLRLGNLVNVIDYYAFQNCNNLKSITFPKTANSSTLSISNHAFSGSNNLEKIVFEGDKVTSLGSVQAFENTKIESGEGYIYVADDLVDSYKTATNWSTFADQIKPSSELEVQE